MHGPLNVKFIGLLTTEDVFVNSFAAFSHVLCLKLVCTVVPFKLLFVLNHLILITPLQKWLSGKMSKLDILAICFLLLYLIVFHRPRLVKSGDKVLSGYQLRQFVTAVISFEDFLCFCCQEIIP